MQLGGCKWPNPILEDISWYLSRITLLSLFSVTWLNLLWVEVGEDKSKEEGENRDRQRVGRSYVLECGIKGDRSHHSGLVGEVWEGSGKGQWKRRGSPRDLGAFLSGRVVIYFPCFDSGVDRYLFSLELPKMKNVSQLSMVASITYHKPNTQKRTQSRNFASSPTGLNQGVRRTLFLLEPQARTVRFNCWRLPKFINSCPFLHLQTQRSHLSLYRYSPVVRDPGGEILCLWRLTWVVSLKEFCFLFPCEGTDCQAVPWCCLYFFCLV